MRPIYLGLIENRVAVKVHNTHTYERMAILTANKHLRRR